MSLRIFLTAIEGIYFPWMAKDENEEEGSEGLED